MQPKVFGRVNGMTAVSWTAESSAQQTDLPQVELRLLAALIPFSLLACA